MFTIEQWRVGPGVRFASDRDGEEERTGGCRLEQPRHSRSLTGTQTYTHTHTHTNIHPLTQECTKPLPSTP